MKTKALSLLACVELIAITSSHAQVTFTKITTGPIVTNLASATSATWVDFDRDGDLDLHVNNRDGANLLYRTEGSGIFTQIKDGPIVNAGLDSHSASWADYDNDGRLDLFIGKPSADGELLFHEQGDGTFVQTTLGPSAALGASWADYDNDGWLDLV